MEPGQGFWTLQLKDVLTLLILVVTIAAIVSGPIWAVKITRNNDDRREERRRRFNVFHSLMKTRRFNLAADHVIALNLVQVEFYGKQKIDTAYRAYIDILHSNFPKIDDPAFERFHQRKEDALYNLLHEIADELGYKYDKRDLQRLAYGPEGWANDEQQERALRGLLVEMLSGQRAIPMIDFEKTMRANSKFPPPPQIEE